MRYTLNAIALGHHDIALKTVEFVRTMKAREFSFSSLRKLEVKQLLLTVGLYSLDPQSSTL